MNSEDDDEDLDEVGKNNSNVCAPGIYLIPISIRYIHIITENYLYY